MVSRSRYAHDLDRDLERSRPPVVSRAPRTAATRNNAERRHGARSIFVRSLQIVGVSFTDLSRKMSETNVSPPSPNYVFHNIIMSRRDDFYDHRWFSIENRVARIDRVVRARDCPPTVRLGPRGFPLAGFTGRTRRRARRLPSPEKKIRSSRLYYCRALYAYSLTRTFRGHTKTVRFHKIMYLLHVDSLSFYVYFFCVSHEAVYIYARAQFIA